MNFARVFRDVRLRRFALMAECVCGLGGIRGQQLVLAPADYVRATGAKVGEIARL